MASEIQNVPAVPELNRKDFVTSNDVRWCPGCGDYAILNSLQRTLPELGVPREKIVIISGIGCSSRFPYYMNTYGFHTIHGRAPTVATGVKVANPDLSVWIVTGDGDGLSIGGNHLLHLLRRNLNVTVLLFNNRIYGLTKGQYSPTSPIGTRTKTTPSGSIDNPINPLLFALGAEATFIARTIDNNPKHMVETFKAAHEHQGVSFVEILQNCVIFNDSAWDPIYSKENREDHLLKLEAGQALLFGKNNDKGIRLNGLVPEIVDVASAAPGEILIHQPDHQSPLHAQMLASFGLPDFPTPIGVIRSIQRPTYSALISDQMEEAMAKKGTGSWKELLHGSSTWTVE
ncbi:MAG: 2-oxoacid:ferredoxin oxidoreductase subunit beta [Luteolibacter sp.]|jgi:2-oxoglutarate ferredoxin oxidoreductase subunit beta|nr:2-oxoacid:ferredoxin oxidoreductase subunit beta [Luteolibacter sp.]